MIENNNVFITNKGKKYHFYNSCIYLKGREFQKISLNQLTKRAKGPCSTCLRLYEKNGGPLDMLNKEEEQKEINDKNINGDKFSNNNIFPIIEDEKVLNILEKDDKKSEESSSSSNSLESFEEKKNNKRNESNFPFNLDEISGIKSNIHNIDSKIDIELSKEKNEINEINNKIKNNNKKVNQIYNNMSDNEEEDEKEEREENNNINNDKIIPIKEKEKGENEIYLNNINDIKNSLENMEKLKYNLNPNLPKKDLNWTGKDFVILKETNDFAKIFFLQDIDKIQNSQEKNIVTLSEKPGGNNNISKDKGKYKFRFEITPIKELKEPIKISVGFEIDYFEENNLIKKENAKMNLFYETMILINHFFIYKKTGQVYAMLNILNGKFFVAGKDEIDKRNKKIFLNSENTDILFLKNFPVIKLENIKEVRPLFKYNKNSQHLANIEAW